MRPLFNWRDIGNRGYRGPRFNTNVGIVDSISRTSYDSERSRRYSRSIRIQSSNVTVLRPRTCQTQVSPGSTVNRRRCHGLHCSDSSTGSGRGPTSDMSPTSTFQSCGNFVQARPSQDPSDPRRARIVPHLESWSVLHAVGPQLRLGSCARPRTSTAVCTCGNGGRPGLRAIA